MRASRSSQRASPSRRFSRLCSLYKINGVKALVCSMLVSPRGSFYNPEIICTSGGHPRTRFSLPGALAARRQHATAPLLGRRSRTPGPPLRDQGERIRGCVYTFKKDGSFSNVYELRDGTVQTYVRDTAGNMEHGRGQLARRLYTRLFHDRRHRESRRW